MTDHPPGLEVLRPFTLTPGTDAEIVDAVTQIDDVALLQSLLVRSITRQRALEQGLQHGAAERRGLLVKLMQLRKERDAALAEADEVAGNVQTSPRPLPQEGVTPRRSSVAGARGPSATAAPQPARSASAARTGFRSARPGSCHRSETPKARNNTSAAPLGGANGDAGGGGAQCRARSSQRKQASTSPSRQLKR